MALKLNVFGSDIDPYVKQKLALRQELARTANFGEAVNLAEQHIGEAIDMHQFNFYESPKDVMAELSSRTPIARLWTAVEVRSDYEWKISKDYNDDKGSLGVPPIDKWEKHKAGTKTGKIKIIYEERVTGDETKKVFYRKADGDRKISHKKVVLHPQAFHYFRIFWTHDQQ